MGITTQGWLWFGAVYLAMVFLIWPLCHVFNFIAELIRSICSGRPMASDNVGDMCGLEYDPDSRLMLSIFWPVLLCWFFVRMFANSVYFICTAAWSRRLKMTTPKWLTIYGITKYTNRLLGHK